ncbi:MAG: hypothetical protein GY906_32220 [bacterium]|nr:hypothetical protein [bacterium]
MTVFFVYIGLVLLFVGTITTIRPLRYLFINQRKTGALVLTAGFTVLAVAMLWPAHLHMTSGDQVRMNESMPAYHANEAHSIQVHATPPQVFRAVEGLRFDELRGVHMLMRLRSLPVRLLGEDDPISADAELAMSSESSPTFIEVLTLGPFSQLARETDQEIVLGLLAPTFLNELRGGLPPIKISEEAAFVAFDQPGYFKATMNFQVQDEGLGWCLLSTETRVSCPDSATRREFMAYWRVIAPWSGFIRNSILSAIEHRVMREATGEQ